VPLLELCQPAGVPRASLSVLTAASGASSDPRSINTQEMTARTRRDSDDVIASESHLPLRTSCPCTHALHLPCLSRSFPRGEARGAKQLWPDWALSGGAARLRVTKQPRPRWAVFAWWLPRRAHGLFWRNRWSHG
jgi:hypothetical protein